ncbi:hypothetical protein [Ahrensia sp. 13_GOM-1096m]|uniref:hypothetical protein n=1 Tax=Ahrensia sp. 13_GOM-1096m TaxID=1380380 RepID=UPI00047CAD40|nr:hypothetical protein [Ahrensia sp. 13_GOM-1096m]
MSIGSVQLIAIVEREYLISIDIERIIADHFNCEIHVIMPDDAQEKLAAINYDVLIIDADMPSEIISGLVPVIARSNPKVVLLTVSDVDPETYIPFPYRAAIAKPFTDEQVVNTLTSLLLAKVV